MLLKWEDFEPDEGSSLALIFDDLLTFQCCRMSTGKWTSLIFGTNDKDLDFGTFACELEAKQAAEDWLIKQLSELNSLMNG